MTREPRDRVMSPRGRAWGKAVADRLLWACCLMPSLLDGSGRREPTVHIQNAQ